MDTPIGSTGSSGGNETPDTISLNALRGQALLRLAGVHERLESKGVGAAFLRAAKPDFLGDMGFLSSLIMHAIIGGPLADFLEEHMPFSLDMMDRFNSVSSHISALGGLEGTSLVQDTEATRNRSFRMSFYPEGRRKSAMKDAKMSRKFNLVSANQNGRFSFDVQAELACMFEIIDMIDTLEKQGVKEMRIDNSQSVYSILKQITHTRGKGLEKAPPARMKIAV